MSMRNALKTTLLAVTAAATLLLALPSQAHESGYRQGHHAGEYRHHDRRHGHHSDRHRGHDRHGGYRHEHYRARHDYGHPPRHAGQQQVWRGGDRHWDGDRDGRRDSHRDERRRNAY